jgi:hypothetical protein
MDMKYIITEEQNNRLWILRRESIIDELVEDALDEIPVGDLSWGEFSSSVLDYVLNKWSYENLSIEEEEILGEYIDGLIEDYHYKEYFGRD